MRGLNHSHVTRVSATHDRLVLPSPDVIALLELDDTNRDSDLIILALPVLMQKEFISCSISFIHRHKEKERSSF